MHEFVHEFAHDFVHEFVHDFVHEFMNLCTNLCTNLGDKSGGQVWETILGGKSRVLPDVGGHEFVQFVHRTRGFGSGDFVQGFVHEFVQESGWQVWGASLRDKSGGPKSGLPNLRVNSHSPARKENFSGPFNVPVV